MKRASPMVPALVEDMLAFAVAAVGGYELREPIGEGGKAQVFRAAAPDGEAVAIKLLRGGADATETELARFEREIRIAESLEHPHLIRVIDHGVDEERGPWLVMPLASGMTLRDLFGGKTLCPEAAIAIVHPLIDALAALHAAGLVHRDVKPENVMLSPLGDVTLVDLGLALSETDARHTKEGEVAGSVRYMSPERIEGLDVDPSADVWAVGAMLYELVAGERPFERASMSEEVGAILGGSFTPLADVDRRVSKELGWLVTVCLASDPWKRPRDGAALLERVRPMMVGALEKARETRVSVLSDPRGFDKRVAPAVVATLRDEARALLADADELEAIRRLERALAYLPDDEETLELVEQASSRAPVRPTARTQEAPPRSTSRSRAPVLVGVAVVVLAIVGGLAWLNDEPTAEPSASPVVDVSEPDAGADAAVEVAAQLHFRPIPPDVLSNEDPERLDEIATAAAGETPERRHADAAEALVALGLVAMQRGQLDDADAHFTRAISAHAEHENALRYRGTLRRRRGRTRDAYRDLVRVLALAPDNVHALAEMVEIYETAGRAGDALPFLRRIVAGHPTDTAAWASLSVALSATGDESRIDEAVEAVETAISLDADNVAAQRQRCTLFAQASRPGAVAACTEAIARAPQAPELFMARANALSREERHVPALADADRAIELEPQTARLYAERAILRERSGDERGAINDILGACQLGHQRSCELLGHNRLGGGRAPGP